MDAERAEFSDYLDSLRRRRRLIVAIWVPCVLLTMLLAVGLPSEYGSTATFQLKTGLSDRGTADNYADRYVSGLTGTVLSSTEMRTALSSLNPYPRLKDDPGRCAEAAAARRAGRDDHAEDSRPADRIGAQHQYWIYRHLYEPLIPRLRKRLRRGLRMHSS